jgi:hypothetical protein
LQALSSTSSTGVVHNLDLRIELVSGASARTQNLTTAFNESLTDGIDSEFSMLVNNFNNFDSFT